MIETRQGDFKLSPAYDLLNTKIHISDTDFALKDGLLPKSLAQGKLHNQFILLGEKAEIPKRTILKIINNFTAHEEKVIELINHSFLNEKLKRNYLQSYQAKVKKIRDAV